MRRLPKIAVIALGALILVLMIGLVSGQFGDVTGGGAGSGSVSGSKYMNVACDVTLYNPAGTTLLSDNPVKIDKVNCQATPASFCVNVLPFSILKDLTGLYDEGSVSLHAGSAVDSKPFKVYEDIGGKSSELLVTYPLSVKCVPTSYSTGTIKVVVDDVVIDSKTISLGGQ